MNNLRLYPKNFTETTFLPTVDIDRDRGREIEIENLRNA